MSGACASDSGRSVGPAGAIIDIGLEVSYPLVERRLLGFRPSADKTELTFQWNIASKLRVRSFFFMMALREGDRVVDWESVIIRV